MINVGYTVIQEDAWAGKAELIFEANGLVNKFCCNLKAHCLSYQWAEVAKKYVESSTDD
jgi:hypothetical protein